MARLPYKVWFNHDGTNMLTCVSPWHAKGEPFREEMLRESVRELSGTGIDAVAFNPGNGAIPWWQSRVYPDHYEWYTERTGNKLSSYGQYIAAGGEMVSVFVEECRKGGLSPIVTLRLKDEHALDNLDKEFVSRFFYEHQHLRLEDGRGKAGCEPPATRVLHALRRTSAGRRP